MIAYDRADLETEGNRSYRSDLVLCRARHVASAFGEAGLTPAVEHAVDQMVGDGAVLGDILMTLLALPGGTSDSRYLLKNSCHNC